MKSKKKKFLPKKVMTRWTNQVSEFISDLNTSIQEICGWGVPINEVFTFSEIDFLDLDDNHTEEDLENLMTEAGNLQCDLAVLQKQLEVTENGIWRIIERRRWIEKSKEDRN